MKRSLVVISTLAVAACVGSSSAPDDDGGEASSAADADATQPLQDTAPTPDLGPQPDPGPGVDAPPAPATTYVVACGTAAGGDDGFRAAAEQLAAYRGAEVVLFDPADIAALEAALAERQPRYVAVVVQPDDMDVNLLRQVLVASTRMDDDPFCDFAFGFITGRDAQEVGDFVARIVANADAPVPSSWLNLADFTVSTEVLGWFEDLYHPLAEANGFESSELRWTRDHPGALAFAKEHLDAASDVGVVEIHVADGDPESLWFFDGSRQPNQLWPFDPALVGQDPDGDMPRLFAADLAALDLSRSVVWSGVDYNGTARRVFVNDDLMATFGTVWTTKEYLVPPDRSVALAVLASGALAYGASLGSGSNDRAQRELLLALQDGLPLGDAVRQGYHDMVMALGGDVSGAFGLIEAGSSLEADLLEPRMRMGAHNRLLFGDPLYAPFAGSAARMLMTEVEPGTGGGYRVRCSVIKEWPYTAALFYNELGDQAVGDWARIYSTLALPAELGEFDVEAVMAVDFDGVPIPLAQQLFLVETIDGGRRLHFQVTSQQWDLTEIWAALTFDLVPRP